MRQINTRPPNEALGLAILLILAALFSLPTQAKAADIVSLAWSVSSLNERTDGTGAFITYLEMDVEIGQYYLSTAGNMAFDDGTSALLHGVGHVDGDFVYFSLNSGAHVLILRLQLPSLNGDIWLYNGTADLIDTGTISFVGVI